MTSLEFTGLYGLMLPDLYPSDRVRCCPTAHHPRSTDGAYFWDRRRGWAWDWSNGTVIQWYDNPDA